MQISVDLSLEQLLNLIRKLPEEQLLKIMGEINSTLNDKSTKEKEEYLNTLLDAPTMSDDQYNSFIENRKKFNQWKTG